jgi:DNA processing protein
LVSVVLKNNNYTSKALHTLVFGEGIVIVSEFSPEAKWNVGYAMQRNATIIGLSDAMLLVESRDSGGTFNAGKTSLRLRHPLFVVRFQDPQKSNAGNDYFIQRGAIQLMKNRETNRANISRLVELVENRSQSSTDNAVSAPEQLTMSLGE